MAIKYDNKKVQFWKGSTKKGKFKINLSVKFVKEFDENEISILEDIINSILEFKYGKGTKSGDENLSS